MVKKNSSANAQGAGRSDSIDIISQTSQKSQEKFSEDSDRDNVTVYDRMGETENENTTDEGGVKYMSRDEGDTSIKEQIKANQALLNLMDIVGTLIQIMRLQ